MEIDLNNNLSQNKSIENYVYIGYIAVAAYLRPSIKSGSLNVKYNFILNLIYLF